MKPEISDLLARFTARELAEAIPVGEAAVINSVSEDTFKRRFPHLIIEVGKRRKGVRRLHAYTLPPAPTDAA